jgi:hypothetical protein
MEDGGGAADDLDADTSIDGHEVVYALRADSDPPARTYQIDIARLRSNVLHRRRTGFFIFNRSRVRPHAQPPRGSHLLVGAIAALKGMRALALTVMGHLDMVRPSICAAWFCRADGDLLMLRSYFVASHVCASNAREPAVKPNRYD